MGRTGAGMGVGRLPDGLEFAGTARGDGNRATYTFMSSVATRCAIQTRPWP